jgi:plasmid stabilization system protein ParE
VRRPLRYHASFRGDLADRIDWLRRHRSAEEVAQLRAAVASFARRVTAHPALGHEVERRAAHSYRVFPIGGRLPYLVWYHFDSADASGPVWLAMLLHEAQDRERFSPERFE